MNGDGGGEKGKKVSSEEGSGEKYSSLQVPIGHNKENNG